MMGQLANKTKGKELTESRPQDGLKILLENNWERISAVLPKHTSPERMFQTMVSCLNQTPKLIECTPVSLLSCLMRCSALGIEPSNVDGLGRSYILPFKNNHDGEFVMEATFIIGYKGIIDLARRSGDIRSIEARAVYEGDEFEYEYTLDGPTLKHNPNPEAEHSPDKLKYAYCIAHFMNGGNHLEVMTKNDIDKIRQRSKAPNSPAWKKDYEAMAKKTTVRRAFPWLPVSVEANNAIAADETSGGFENIFKPPLVPNALPETTDDTESQGVVDIDVIKTRYAACKKCGQLKEITADAILEDLGDVECSCGVSDWEIKEG